MKERPILFSGAMVRALLDGSKTQTRRAVQSLVADRIENCEGFLERLMQCSGPYGKPGDRLWVREAWKAHTTFDHMPPRDIPQTQVWYMSDDGYKPASRYRHGRFMPRWASRITLEVVSVRVERLQDISETDAEAEGCERLDTERYERDWKLCPKCGGTGLHNALGDNGGVIFDVDCRECDTYVKRYRHLWNAINGPDAWAANPWVWVVEFRPCPHP